MKVGIIKLGARISFNASDTSGGNGEARSIIAITEAAGAEIHIYTKILKKDDLLPQYHWHQIAADHDTSHLDYLLVINGRTNFFGGAEDIEQILNYKIINQFHGKVFYAYCDPALTLVQLWPAIEGKDWGKNWNKDDILITRNDITYISQPFDIAAVKKLLPKTVPAPDKIIHYPFEQFPMMRESFPFNETPSVDLSYGGTMRGGKRVKKMEKFYFGYDPDISVEMFGKITEDDFLKLPKFNKELSRPVFTKSVRYDMILPKMNDAMCHVAIGDPLYEEINDVAQRVYESINASVVTFIDSDMDKNRRVYGNDDFFYVASREDVQKRIRFLKANPDVRKKVIKKQFDLVKFDVKSYSKGLLDILEAK